MTRIRVKSYRLIAAIAGAGVLLASGNCLPQDYFATLAGDTLSLTVAEIMSRALTAALDGAAAGA